MSLPQFPPKMTSLPTLRALDILLKNNKVDSLAELPKPPKYCILSPSPKVRELIKKKMALTEGPNVITPVYIHEDKLAVYTGFIGFGSPMWVWALEQLIAWGVTDFIFIGWFGKVNPLIQNSKIFAVAKALRDEGTSYHYSDSPDRWSYPDSVMTAKMLEMGAKPISIWTTDAMFRQTSAEIDYAVASNIAGFEMECSALFTVARYFECNMASIQMVSDYYIDGKYESIYATNQFALRLKQAVEMALTVCGTKVKN
ncbi:MAG: purine nucleoside phosphorylase [bacterium ADurb.Bin400]|nr:MAG: purine nucleoside phosphorylase [bacterium ADurb.Bin400]